MLTKEQRRAAVKAACDRVLPSVAAVLASDAAIAKAKDEFRDWVVSQYESGWYIEKPDYSKPLEACAYIEVAGPYRTKALALSAVRDYKAFARKCL